MDLDSIEELQESRLKVPRVKQRKRFYGDSTSSSSEVKSKKLKTKKEQKVKNI